jgi:hypothetical protein
LPEAEGPVHAEDVIQQSRNPWTAGRLPPLWYGEGVKFSITWLLGDSTAPPVDPAGRGPYGQDSELPALLHDAETRQRREGLLVQSRPAGVHGRGVPRPQR